MARLNCRFPPHHDASGRRAEELDTLCDNLRSIEDLTDVHAAADLFRVI
ncbi:hypothetical protein ACF08M_31050 [Streptomyces sp. NPDC015032]